MISDDERKKAAKFLRERKCLELDCHECHQMSEMALGNKYALCDIDGQWGALADLIDRPTCENGERLNERTFLCSACGYEAYAYSDSNCNPHDFSYCPDCGAEVIE